MRGKIKRALAGLFVLLLALCLSAGLYVGLKGYGMYREALEQKPLAEMAEQVRAQPDFTPLDELPRLYRDAVVAVEDHRFYSHGGVDFIALCRALWNDVCAGAFVEGGSTITQQLAKKLYFTQEKVRGVHGMGHREAVYQGRDPGAVCEFHLFRQRIL